MAWPRPRPSGAHSHRGDLAGLVVLAWLRVARAARPPLKRTAWPPRGARAEYEEEKFAVPGGGGEPEPSGPLVFKCTRRRPRPGRPPGGPELCSGGWRRVRPEAAEELLRAVAAGPGDLQETLPESEEGRIASSTGIRQESRRQLRRAAESPSC